MNKPEPTALRAVHLLGGLQAEDFDGDTVDIVVDGCAPILQFARPPFRELYSALEKRGFQPIGVRIIEEAADGNGLNPANWHAWKTPRGLVGREIIQAWSDLLRCKEARADESIGELAAKLSAYLRLCNIRLFQLAMAYHDMLRHKLTSDGVPAMGTLFSNPWTLYVDAAIHAYLADAAALRDALAEAVWRLVLKNTNGAVTSMKGLRKHAKTSTHTLAMGMLADGADGGWIKNLTDLRNDVIHVAPVSTRQEHRLSEIRMKPLTGGKSAPVLHHPLTDARWAPPARLPRARDYNDEAEVKASFDAYRAFVATSGDALEYAWRTLGHLMTLADDVRLASGLKGETLTITDADIIGEPIFR